MDQKSHPAAAGQVIYEDVEPQYQWLPGKDADTLIVNLTRFKGEAEFKKEHLKVKIDSYGNLKVSGERPLPSADGRNRWRRFQKVYRVAEDCNTSEIKAKFDNGSLSVVMPKLPKDQLPSPPPPAAAAQTPSDTPAAPEPVSPVKPEPTASPAPRKAPEEGTPAIRPSQPPPPAAETATRRRPRWAVVVAVALVVAAVGLGIYCWRCRSGVGPHEQQLQMEGFGDDY